MKVLLNPAEENALLVGCPLCGQQKGKKCRSTRSVGPKPKLLPRPHKARCDQARELSDAKARKNRAKHAVGNGDLTNDGLVIGQRQVKDETALLDDDGAAKAYTEKVSQRSSLATAVLINN